MLRFFNCARSRGFAAFGLRGRACRRLGGGLGLAFLRGLPGLGALRAGRLRGGLLCGCAHAGGHIGVFGLQARREGCYGALARGVEQGHVCRAGLAFARQQGQRDELLARQRDAQAVIEDQSQTLRELQTTPPAPIPEENPQEIQPTNPPETPEQAQAALQATQAALQAAQIALNQALSERAALPQQQKQDEQCRQTHARQQAQIQARQQAAQRWRALNQLIGSASGDAFRRYAQQYTLDVLLAYANQHLARLAPRYRLQRGLDPWSLCIADGEFADELRSAHSLSGGESFLVSLALALGLASLSSEKVKVESLFIDEGFGSLDADTLQTVMQALDRLQAGGRRIGVISHVHDMAERIGVQIRIQPQGGGQSALTVQG